MGICHGPSSPWEITRAVSWRFPWGSFLSCILPEAAAVPVFCLIFFFICLLGKSMLQMILVCIAVLGGSAALYFLVAENSAFMALRYLNLFYFLQTDRLLTAYKNVNLFGQPVSLLAAAMVLLTAAAAVFCRIKHCGCPRVPFSADSGREGAFPEAETETEDRKHNGI